MEKIYKPKEFSDMLGVTVTTLQRWDNEKKLIAYRNPKGRRFYTHTQYEEYMGINQAELSPQEELIQDLIAIIHVFSCRIYGLRKYKKKIKEDKSL